MNDLVFVGSEAEGYYGGAYDCFGVFVSKEYFDKHNEILRRVFTDRSHGELDGKYSDVYGDLVVVKCKGPSDVLSLLAGTRPEIAPYHFSGLIDGEEVEELGEVIEDLIEHIDEISTKVANVISNYYEYKVMLTAEEATAVTEFIKEMRTGD